MFKSPAVNLNLLSNINDEASTIAVLTSPSRKPGNSPYANLVTHSKHS